MKNSIKISYKLMAVILLCMLIAVAVLAFIFIKPAFRPAFFITGDVGNTLEIGSTEGFDTYTVQRGGAAYESLKLSELIEKGAPFSDSNTIAIRGGDGFIAQADGDRLDGMYITYTAQYGWEMINEYHPASAGVKGIKDIWVVSGKEIPAHSVSIISAEENIAVYSPGQFFMSETRTAPVFQGRSENPAGNENYGVSVYIEKRYRYVTDIAPGAKSVLVVGEGGQYGRDASPGMIALCGNTLQYIYSDGRTAMDNVRGIVADPPDASISDAFHEAANSLSAGSRALVILTDGFGYHQYTYAVQNGYAPFLASLKPAAAAASAYETVTNTGTAMILTGQPPGVNGVYAHGMRELKCPDIFAYAADENKTAACIEGSTNILDLSVEPVLNADRNGSGSNDDEVFEAAKQALSGGTDYVFVHFHGIDDTGAQYGDLDKHTMEKIAETDTYIAALTEDYNGVVIIVSDHGMHSVSGGGSHGACLFEDMIVPYISFYWE